MAQNPSTTSTSPILTIFPTLGPTTTSEVETTATTASVAETTTLPQTTVVTTSDEPPTTTSELTTVPVTTTQPPSTTEETTLSTTSESLPPETTSTSSEILTTSSSAPSMSTVFSTDAGGSTVTVITVTAAPASSSAATSSAAATSGGSKGFFANTGAVAGVFTVVGLIAVALIAWVVSFIIRRRRSQRLDRDFSEAAASAPPVFLDDDPYSSPRRPSGGAGGYSDASSHGTYGQHPMSAESYEMAGPSPGGVFDYTGAGYGAAGVGAGNIQRSKSMGGQDPYAAYAYAEPATNYYPDYAQQHHQQQQQAYYGQDTPAAYGSPPDSPDPNSQNHHQPDALSRATSKGSRSLLDPAPTSAGVTSTESYASYYATPATSGGNTAKMPNPYESEDEDDGAEADGGRKVLKVANE